MVDAHPRVAPLLRGAQSTPKESARVGFVLLCLTITVIVGNLEFLLSLHGVCLCFLECDTWLHTEFVDHWGTNSNLTADYDLTKGERRTRDS